MYLTNEIIAKLEALGVSPKKALGQNFLVSTGAIEKIVNAVKAMSPQYLVEIGPGLGSLTESLVALELPLTLLELDRMFSAYWRERNFEVVEGDALRWDWGQLAHPKGTVLVSNLPYQISSSIVIDRSVPGEDLKGMVLMFQKEVAERITARPKTEAYGLLSVIAQNFWNISTVLDAGPRDFYPPPKIASRVLAFVPRADISGNRRDFLRVVKAGFAQRRKYLLSNLKALGRVGMDESLRRVFNDLDLSQQVRAEELAVSDWRRLTQKLYGDLSL